jgi:hypothetical protein
MAGSANPQSGDRPTPPGRPPAQPGFNAPLTKISRGIAIGDEPTDRLAEDAPPSPARPARTTTSPAPPPPGRQPAATSDGLLSKVLAGPKTTRSFPITRLDPELHATFRTISVRSNVSIQDLVNGAAREWLYSHQQELVDNGMLDP